FTLPNADLATILRSRKADPHDKKFRTSPAVLDFYCFSRPTQTTDSIYTSSPSADITHVRGLLERIPIGISTRNGYWHADNSSRLETIAHCFISESAHDRYFTLTCHFRSPKTLLLRSSISF